MSTESRENIFTEFGEAAKDAAGKAVNGLKTLGMGIAGTSKEVMSDAKLNARREQKHQEIEAEYQKLGELAYQKGGLTGEMAQVAEKIHKLYGELQDIEMARNDT